MSKTEKNYQYPHSIGSGPSQAAFQRFEQICKAAGLKVTQQRLEIYRQLLKAKDHPAAETLHSCLARRLPTLSLDTVYRTLATFERLGLLHRLETTSSQARYEALTTPHHHFLCNRCGTIIDFRWQEFDALEPPPPPDGAGRVERTNAVMHGQCADCLQAFADTAQN